MILADAIERETRTAIQGHGRGDGYVKLGRGFGFYQRDGGC